MYQPSHFRETDRTELLDFIGAHAFGQLVSRVAGRLFCSHLPFLPAADGTLLYAHVARQNPQHEDIDGQEVLAVFTGPHDYVSPTWYDGPGVPTWNYQAVHVYGTARVFRDEQRLQRLVEDLTARYESGFDAPWQPVYRPAMLQAIVGIEIAVTGIQGKYKLSQNRPPADRRRVIDALRERGSVSLAEAMARQAGRSAPATDE